MYHIMPLIVVYALASPQEEPFKVTKLRILELSVEKNTLVLGSTKDDSKNHFTMNEKTVFLDEHGKPLKDGMKSLKVGMIVSAEGWLGKRIGCLCTKVTIEPDEEGPKNRPEKLEQATKRHRQNVVIE